MQIHFTDNGARAMIKGAFLYKYGEYAAFNTEIAAAAWDCWCNAIRTGSSAKEAITECVECINLDAFLHK